MKISLVGLFAAKPKAIASDRGITLLLGQPVLFLLPILIIILAALIFGAFQRIIALVATSLFVLVLAGVSWLWSRESTRGLSSRLVTGRNRVFPDEEVDLIFELSNTSGLFLNWLEIEAELPYRLVTGVLSPLSPYMKERVRWTTSILGGQKLAWKDRLTCKARGEYLLGPVRLRSGDVFGLFPRELVLPRLERLLVYPRIIPVDRLPLPLRELVGERAVRKNIYEDVSRTMGVREYQLGDPLKRIHWKATARSGELQTRQYESTTTLRLVLALDVHSFGLSSEIDDELFEHAVTIVASLASQAFHQDFLVGLLVNGSPAIRMAARSGRDQFMLMLEALARIKPDSRQPLQKELEKYRGSMQPGTTFVTVTADLSASIIGLVHQVRQQGHSVALVNVGDSSPVRNIGDIPVITVSRGHHFSQPEATGK